MFPTASPSDVEPSDSGDPVSGALTASLAASRGVSAAAGAAVVPHAAAKRLANDENTLIHRLPCSAIMIRPFWLGSGRGSASGFSLDRSLVDAEAVFGLVGADPPIAESLTRRARIPRDGRALLDRTRRGEREHGRLGRAVVGAA